MTNNPVDFYFEGSYRAGVAYLFHRPCGGEVAELDFDDTVSVTAEDIAFKVMNHECPKPVSPAEDSFMTNAEIQETRDAAVATGKFQVRKKPQVSKGNPYEKIEENGGSLIMTVVPKKNML